MNAPTLNVRQVELFYHVATHGGISAAVRRIPHGIGQPALSGQMGRLEADAGVRLFERSPFRLTPEGEKLFARVRPFFEGLPDVMARLRAPAEPELRIGGAEIVLRDHVPAVMRIIRARHPAVRLRLEVDAGGERLAPQRLAARQVVHLVGAHVVHQGNARHLPHQLLQHQEVERLAAARHAVGDVPFFVCLSLFGFVSFGRGGVLSMEIEQRRNHSHKQPPNNAATDSRATTTQTKQKHNEQHSYWQMAVISMPTQRLHSAPTKAESASNQSDTLTPSSFSLVRAYAPKLRRHAYVSASCAKGLT